jgi:hypothetical protein
MELRNETLTNPLISDSPLETAEKTMAAMNALMRLLGDKNSDFYMLMLPIEHALEHLAGQLDREE